jgi:hypothetical protein
VEARADVKVDMPTLLAHAGLDVPVPQKAEDHREMPNRDCLRGRRERPVGIRLAPILHALVVGSCRISRLEYEIVR